MNRPTERPGCWTTIASPRRSQFETAPWGSARGCSQAASPDLWTKALDHTPTCAGCARAEYAIRRWTTDQRRKWRPPEC